LDFFWGLAAASRDNLTDFHVIDILSDDVKPDEVTNINLNECRGITDETLEFVAERCPQLQILAVNRCRITDVGISAINKNCPHLRKLSYQQCTDISDAALDAIATKCPLLETLLAAIHCPQLGHAPLKKADKQKSIQEEGKTLDFLGGLAADSRHKLTDFHVINILSDDVKPDEVTNINLNACMGITDKTLKVVAKRCPQLQILTVNRCRIITDVGIVSIIENCRIITDVGISAIIENCPHLRKLSYQKFASTYAASATIDGVLGKPEMDKPINPEDCEVMVSFNDAASGQDAEDLANFLTAAGHPTFCTRIYCPDNCGSWRQSTKDGAVHCQYYVALMSNGWQKSFECQFETEIIENRRPQKEVTVIPVYYCDFDDIYDIMERHHYKTTWNGIQSVKRNIDDWMKGVLGLLPNEVRDDRSSSRNLDISSRDRTASPSRRHRDERGRSRSVDRSRKQETDKSHGGRSHSRSVVTVWSRG